MKRNGLITISELAKSTSISRATIDRYERLQILKPVCEDSASNTRYFDNTSVNTLKLIKVLQKRPFRLLLEDIKKILDQFPLDELLEIYQKSDKTLLSYLSEKNFL
jgi:DNA-binding transcriptional MerR regulator